MSRGISFNFLKLSQFFLKPFVFIRLYSPTVVFYSIFHNLNLFIFLLLLIPQYIIYPSKNFKNKYEL